VLPPGQLVFHSHELRLVAAPLRAILLYPAIALTFKHIHQIGRGIEIPQKARVLKALFDRVSKAPVQGLSDTIQPAPRDIVFGGRDEGVDERRYLSHGRSPRLLSRQILPNYYAGERGLAISLK
jgi:hypothetical protein